MCYLYMQVYVCIYIQTHTHIYSNAAAVKSLQ